MFEKVSPETVCKWSNGKTVYPVEAERIGVYGLFWQDVAYIGMTASSGGFKSRWGKHKRTLFQKRSGTNKNLRKLIKSNDLMPDDFLIAILRSWEQVDILPQSLLDEIYVEERRVYDEVAGLGFTMINPVPPSGPNRKTHR